MEQALSTHFVYVENWKSLNLYYNMTLGIERELYEPKNVINHPDFKILNSKPTNKDLNLSVCYNQHKEIHLVQKPRFELAPGQVEVHIKATGICGSDIHFWKHSKIGDSMVVRDICGCGHESAGEVVKVHESVKDWKVGDRVALECGVPCAQCEMCRLGRYNACPNVIFFSTPPHFGTMSRYHIHPSTWLHRLPDNVSFEEGALCEPLAVAMAAIDRSGLKLADPIMIAGAGPIGLVTLLAARAAGAEPIVITDLSQTRLEFAKSLVPSVKTILIEKSLTPKQVADKVKEAAEFPLKLALECTGVESSIHASIYSMNFGGKVFIIGVGKDEQTIPFMYLSANEIDLQWQYRYANQYPKAIRCVSGGLINLKPLVSHRYNLEDAIDGFNVASNAKSGAIKVQITD